MPLNDDAEQAFSALVAKFGQPWLLGKPDREQLVYEQLTVGMSVTFHDVTSGQAAATVTSLRKDRFGGAFVWLNFGQDDPRSGEWTASDLGLKPSAGVPQWCQWKWLTEA